MAKQTKGRAKRAAAGGPKARKRSVKKTAGAHVQVGLHGLGKLLRSIHRHPRKLQAAFERHMGPASVMVDASTARKIKRFAAANLPQHPMNRDDCDCDPRTDPFCICF
jgi:hypothetical protein